MIIKAPRPPKGVRSLSAGHIPQPKGKGSNGRNFCRVCHCEVGPRRRSVCDEKCERMLLDLIDPARVVEREEKGVCQLCGWDTQKLIRVLFDTREHMRDLTGWTSWYEISRGILSPLGISAGSHITEFDHIIPIVEGGRHERANLRTLCLPCHKGETATLMRRMALASLQEDRDALYTNQMELICE